MKTETMIMTTNTMKTKLSKLPLAMASSALMLSLVACHTTESNEHNHTHDHENGETHETHSHANSHTDSSTALTPAKLQQMITNDSVTIADELVDCTLANGVQTQCISISVKVNELGQDAGPWCPRNINDGADKAGIWLNDGKVYDADGEFVKNLATFYADDEWELYNPKTGEVKVTDSKEACLAAAKPNVEEAYQNHCVECQADYVEAKNLTYLIPASPVAIDSPAQASAETGVGIALNGVKLEAAAPVDAILSAHTLAPFDDEGGHINTHVGYHIHAVTDETVKATGVAQEHSTLIGYAMDSYPIFSHDNLDGTTPTDLDECHGHEVEGIGYHYHAGEAGSNQIIGCFKAQPGCAIEDGENGEDGESSTVCEASRRPPINGMGGMGDGQGRGMPPVDENGNILPPPDQQ